MKRIFLTIALLSLLVIGGAGMAESGPHSLQGSGVWYAPIIEQNFPSHVRVCGFETPIDAFKLYPKDITKFMATSNVAFSQQLLGLIVKGTVAFGPLGSPFKATKRNKKKYAMYIEGFFFSPDGRLYDVQSFAKEGGNWVSIKGGKVDFSMVLARGYDFGRGGWVLLLASGEPLSSGAGEAECVLLGAKKITLD